MNALVLGGGRMGSAICFGLAKLGAFVELYEEKTGHDLLVQHKLKKLGVEIELLNTNKHQYRLYDIVVSALPYVHNYEIARRCKEQGVRYCDLGGHPDTSKAIQSLPGPSAVFTDLGLAPGLVNIIAEYGIARLENPIAVEMIVGGLPQEITNAAGYGVVFSPKGLWNEYAGDCEILEDGEIKTVTALSGLRKEGEGYESFYTKGGIGNMLPLMKARGIQHCAYRTYRYAGHCNLMTFLLHDCQVDDDTFISMIEKACPPPDKDKVLIHAKVQNETETWSRMYTIKSDDNWTAMQKSTAFPTAVIAMLMGEDKLDMAPVLNYAHANYEKFFPSLTKLLPELIV